VVTAGAPSFSILLTAGVHMSTRHLPHAVSKPESSSASTEPIPSNPGFLSKPTRFGVI
jgi:hypothetical protein